MPRKKSYPHLFTRHQSPYLYFHWWDESGVRHERSTRKKIGDEEVADQIRITFLEEVRRGHFPTDLENWPLGQAIESWLEFRRGRVADGSLASEKASCTRFLEIFGKEIKLKNLADVHKINQYERARLDAPVSPKTINNEVLVLKGLLARADLWHRVAGKYKKLKVDKCDVGATLTSEESKRLIRYARSAPEMAVAPYAALVSHGSGMRDWEIKALKLGDVHIGDDKPHVYVRRATTKTNAGARFAALDPIAHWAMQKLVFRAHTLGSSKPEHHLLPAYIPAHTRSTDPLHGLGDDFNPAYHQTTWEWERVQEETDLEHRRFHDLRHTYISRAAEAGVPLPVLMAQVGHMSQRVLAIYTHVSGRALHDAAERIASASRDLICELPDRPSES